MSVFARLLLHNTAAFLQLFRTAAGHSDFAAAAAAAATSADPAQALLLALLDLWLDKTDAIGGTLPLPLSAAHHPLAVMPIPLPALHATERLTHASSCMLSSCKQSPAEVGCPHFLQPPLRRCAGGAQAERGGAGCCADAAGAAAR